MVLCFRIILNLCISVISLLLSNIKNSFDYLKHPEFFGNFKFFCVCFILCYLCFAIFYHHILLSKHLDKKKASEANRAVIIIFASWPFIFNMLEFRLISTLWLMIGLGLLLESIKAYRKEETNAIKFLYPAFVISIYFILLNISFLILNR